MYVPSAFVEDRPSVLHAFMKRYDFATLVTAGADGPAASHVPVLLLPDRGRLGMLQAHFARQNEHWRAFAEGAGSVLAIFHGPHGYVSPTWYATRQAVPTWNYVVVHARGTPRLLTDEQLAEHLRALVGVYESGRPDGWDERALAAGSAQALRRAIVGTEIEITHLQGKWKLGQNRTPADRAGAIRGLRAAGDAASAELAQWMADAMDTDAPARPAD